MIETRKTDLSQRKPIISARQVAVTVIFGAIAAAFELLQITIPGYLPGVNFNLGGIWLTLSTMIGGPIVGAIVVLIASITGQVGIAGWPGYLIHVLILAAFYPRVYRIQKPAVRLGAFFILTAVALVVQYQYWNILYSTVFKIMDFIPLTIFQFSYPVWVYLVIYYLVPAIILAAAPRFVAPEWRWPWVWPWDMKKEKDAEVIPEQD